MILLSLLLHNIPKKSMSIQLARARKTLSTQPAPKSHEERSLILLLVGRRVWHCVTLMFEQKPREEGVNIPGFKERPGAHVLACAGQLYYLHPAWYCCCCCWLIRWKWLVFKSFCTELAPLRLHRTPVPQTYHIVIPELYTPPPGPLLVYSSGSDLKTYSQSHHSTCLRQKDFLCVSSPEKSPWNQPQIFPVWHLC